MDSEIERRVILMLIDLIDFALADEEGPDLAERARQDPDPR